MTPAAATARSDKAREAARMLDEHVRELAEQMARGKSEKLVRWLEFVSRFHSYSAGNLVLILVQKPDATHVAGLRQWNRMGRKVRAGEKGIAILAPMTVRAKSETARVKEEEESEGSDGESPSARRSTYFKPVHVFDVSQTEGAELPRLIEATGDASASLPALAKAVRTAGIVLEELVRVPGAPSASGASFGGRIVVRSDLAPPEAFRTLAHEFAHELLHWPKDGSPKEPSRKVRETEADATAYVVCRRFGIDCDAADYLLLYDADPKLLLGRLETVRTTSAKVIDAILSALDDGPEAEA